VEETPEAAGAPDERQYQRLTAKAGAAEARGNVVRAAILRGRAASVATLERAEAAKADARSAMERLLSRLQAALDLPATGLDTWRTALLALLEPASEGLWPVEARLLYDLQKVCIDHERAIYALDLVEWFVSWGRRPVKRLLPNQGQVLTVKHLRVAARRMPHVRLPHELRRPFVDVLLSAIARSEERLRNLLRPAALQALEDVGLRPESVPESVARDKLIEELLDRVVERDFLQMGDLRDAIARNRLKLPDLADPAEFFVGDRLIRANRRLAAALDGVYRRGEIYLRWLQRLSSLAFGTRVGRFLTRYVVLPVGGAFVALEGLGHLIHLTGLGHMIREFTGHKADRAMSGASAVGLGTSPPGVGPFSVAAALLADTTHKVHLVNRYSLPLTALFLLGLLYFPSFRHAVVEILRRAWLVVRGVCYDLPRFVLNLPVVRLVVNSRPYLCLYHYVLKPLSWAAPVSLGLLLAGVDEGVALGAGGGVFLAVGLLVNSRLGMQVEEALSDRLARAWRLLRFDLIPGLFRLILYVFKRMLEEIEKFLYTIDELLRFKAGESRLSLYVKPVLGLAWFFLTYLIRVVINLFVEPTFNPIKHFPVVTVAAKMLLPFLPILERLLRGPLEPLVGVWLGRLFAVVILFLLPGLAGFLVWELKENWRLYRANQSPTLDPIVVGSHGETVLRLLRPGLHSGTLPRLFAKLRRARGAAARKQRAALHHVGEGVRHFVARELLAYLAVSKRWGVPAPEVRAVHLGCKRIRTELACPAVADDCLAFDLEEHGSRLVAGIAQAGWTDGLGADQANALADALAGFYKLAGVNLVREQLADGLPAGSAYDVVEEGLIVWAGPGYESGALYDLNGSEELVSQRLAGTPPAKFRKLKAARILFRETPVFWVEWVAQWDADAAGKRPRHRLQRSVRLLP
jgi:hypothetical protein